MITWKREPKLSFVDIGNENFVDMINGGFHKPNGSLCTLCQLLGKKMDGRHLDVLPEYMN